MKERFTDKKFSPEALELIRHAEIIIDRYREQGYKLSLRQLYYQCVSQNIVPNTEQSYDRVGNVIGDARMAGLCDWEMIEDRNRETVTPSHWNNPAEIIDVCAKQYRTDKWASQPFYCEVMVEKQALEGVLEPVCRELDIPFTANKGYSSITMMHQTGKRLAREFKTRCKRNGLVPAEFESDSQRNGYFVQHLIDCDGVLEGLKLSEDALDKGFPRIVVFYLGDHDPSGIDMTRDVLDRLRIFSDYTPIEVVRLALNMEQIDELNPPENPAKMSDSRAKDYVSKFGHSSWELDAVAPDAMAQMVRDAVSGIRNDAIWNRSVESEKKEREQLETLAKNWNKPGPDAKPKKKGKK